MQQNVDEIKTMDITELVNNLESNNIESIQMEGGPEGTVEGTLKDETKFTSFIPEELRSDFYPSYLKDKVENEEIRLIGKPEPADPWYFTLLPTILLLLVFLLVGQLFMMLL